MALARAMADGPPPAWKSVRNLHALKNFGADIKVRIDFNICRCREDHLGLRHMRALHTLCVSMMSRALRHAQHVKFANAQG